MVRSATIIGGLRSRSSLAASGIARRRRPPSRARSIWRAGLWALAGLAALSASNDVRGGDARRVRLAVNLGGARVALDRLEVPWFGETLAVVPGTHNVTIDVPGSKCCRAVATRIDVHSPPADDPQALQTFTFRLEILPARVTLIGAPVGSHYRCPGIGVGGPAGEIHEIQLAGPHWSGVCEISPPVGAARAVQVELEAGELNAIEWPR
jgi:hypothetical protein